MTLLLACDEATDHARQLARHLAGQREELRLAHRRLAAQFAVTRALAGATRLDDAIAELLPCVAPAFGAQRAAHFSAGKGGALSPVRRWSAPGASAPESVLSGDDPLAIALRSGAIVSISSLVEAGSAGAAQLAAEGIVAVGGVPIEAGSAPEGVLAFLADSVNVFDDTAVFFLVDLGARLSDFLHRIHAAEQWDAHARMLADQSDQLALARDEALEASRLKSTFLASVSHELRTPLSGVVGMTKLLLDGRLDPPERELAELLASSADGLRCIIDDILDFSKLESGRVESETLEVDVGDLIEQVTAQFGPAAAARGVDLVCSLDPAFATPVLSDPTRLRQVVANLVANAVKFTHAGHISVRADLLREPGADSLRVEVRDTGIGIDCDKAARLFQPFTQADGSTTRRYGGTGLGLAICRQLIELLGGKIDLESIPGKGSTFRFIVPVRVVAGVSAELAPLRGVAVLVADDRVASREAARVALKGAGARVVAVSLAEARFLARSPRPGADVLLLGLESTDEHFVNAAMELLQAFPARAVMLPPGASNLAVERCGVLVDAIGHKPIRPSVVVGRVLAALGLADELAPPSRPDLTPVAAAPRGKALVAEDDHVNQLITSSYLRRLGYEVDVVADGGAAIEAAERGGYDVLVLDAHMPVLDGLAVTRRVRALPDARAQVRIIALTAGASASDRAACLDAGMDDFIAKPATSEALDAALTAPRGSPQVSRSGIWAARQSPIIDRNRLRELLEVDQTGAVGREVVGLFRISIADRLDRLSGPLAADASGTRAEAHAIKGAAESVGAATLALLARRIESSAARGDLSTVPFLLAEARSAFSRAVETLEKALAAPAP